MVNIQIVPRRFEELRELAAPVAERFAEAGYRLYLVGGSVRDALAPPPDGQAKGATPSENEAGAAELDFTTDAPPEEIERILKQVATALWTQGKRFGTIGCSLGGRRLEVTTHRSEAYNPDSRKPEVAFTTQVEADLSRRDFTINAIALSLPDLVLVDPFDGMADLAAGRLRTPLAPEVSFSDDPLRMLRAARFVSGRLSSPKPGWPGPMVPSEELVAAVEAMHHRLGIVSAERIRDELDKLLVVADPSPGLWFCVKTGLAGEFLPELPALALEQDPIHRHKDVLAHTIAVVAKTRPDRILRLAALFHDVGKPSTRRVGKDGVSFHHHDVVGARMTRARMSELRYSNDDIEKVSRLVELHLRFHTYKMGWTDSAVRRYVRDAGEHLERLNELTRCDCTTRNPAKARALAKRMDELERRIAELREKEELDAIRPDLDGNQVMTHLGIPPGRDVGRALEFLLEIRMAEGPIGEEEAYRRLDQWWASATRG